MLNLRRFLKGLILFALFLSISTGSLFAQNSSIHSGATGATLIDLLQSDYYPTSPNSYNSARDAMYATIDNLGGQVSGVYTGYTITTSTRSDAFNKGINTEHTFPQGYFNSNSPMVGDIHHLFPTRIEANSARSNNPFDEIPDQQTQKWFYDNIESTGIPASNIDLYSESTSSAFEPREDFKGNVARAIFYFWTMYQDNPVLSDDVSFFEGMKETLYAWHAYDPVDQAEVDRSLAVESVQGNRNPFIHDTTLVRRAYFEGDGGNGDPGDDPGDDPGTEHPTDIHETFSNVPDQGNSYGMVNWTGDNDGNWTATDSRTDETINGTAITVRNGSLTSPEFQGGIGSLTLTTQRKYTGTSNNLTVYVNDTEVGTIAYDETVQTHSIADINIEGSVMVEIETPGNGDRVAMDDLKWSQYSQNDTVEVEISGNAGWRMLSFPITGGTVADISDDTAIQGIIGGDHEGNVPNFKIFKNGTDSSDFAVPADINTSFGDGYGFITHFYDNTNNGSSELPITLSVSGSEPSGDITVDLNDSGNFTLVGNPFSSNFELSALTADGTIQENVHFWDNSIGSYVVVSRQSAVIKPWQGFWVESGSTILNFPETGKTESAATNNYFSKGNIETNRAVIQFTLSSDSTHDEAIRLTFDEEATLGWDEMDASKFVPLTESYATLAFMGEENLQSVYSLPINLVDKTEVKLKDSLVGVSGEFTFGWDGIEQLPADLNITLHDYETGETVNMRQNNNYVFTVEGPAKSKVSSSVFSTETAIMQKSDVSGRFGIVLNGETTGTEYLITPSEFKLEQNYPNPFNPSTVIRYQIAVNSEVSLKVFDMLGREVATLVDGRKSSGNHQVSFDASKLSSGIYIYRLKAGNEILTRQMTLIK